MKKTNGITLVALVITIVILIILATISINTLLGENGIIKKAEKVKEVTDLAGLKEQVEFAKLSMLLDNNGRGNILASELMDYLVVNGVLKEDKVTFKNNEAYSLYPNGNIMNNEEIVDHVNLTSNVAERTGKMVNSSTYGSFNGTGYIYDGTVISASGDRISDTIIALQPPLGYQFAYWMNENNDIVSYDSQYIETGVNIMCLYAVSTKEPVEASPTVSVSVSPRFKVGDTGAEKDIVSINTIWDMQEGYQLKETGAIRTYESSYKNKLTLNDVDNQNVKKTTSSITTKKGTYCSGITMSQSTRIKSMYARAYAIYTDSSGNEVTIYSNVAVSEPLS